MRTFSQVDHRSQAAAAVVEAFKCDGRVPEKIDTASILRSISLHDYILIGCNVDGSMSSTGKHYVGNVEEIFESGVNVSFMTCVQSYFSYNIILLYYNIYFILQLSIKNEICFASSQYDFEKENIVFYRIILGEKVGHIQL